MDGYSNNYRTGQIRGDLHSQPGGVHLNSWGVTFTKQDHIVGMNVPRPWWDEPLYPEYCSTAPSTLVSAHWDYDMHNAAIVYGFDREQPKNKIQPAIKPGIRTFFILNPNFFICLKLMSSLIDSWQIIGVVLLTRKSLCVVLMVGEK